VPDPSTDSSRDPASAARSDGSRDPKTRDILARLKSVEGHVRGVARMVEEDAYCMDLVHQLRGVQRALSKVTGLILDRHLHSCATAALRGDDPEDRERVIQELLDAFAAAERG
jgi:DNA-binding FrmR family transcriptional regulator